MNEFELMRGSSPTPNIDLSKVESVRFLRQAERDAQGLPPVLSLDDARIPEPYPDGSVRIPTVLLNTGLILPPKGAAPTGPSRFQEEEVPKKIGIYAFKDSTFTVSVLDEDNDPIESFQFDATTIAEKVRPLLDAAGHKTVDYSGGMLTQTLTAGKVRTMRPRKTQEGMG